MTRRDESCYVQSPNAQTVLFAGRPISLSAISRTTGITTSYLSRIFQGQRQPTVHVIRKISTALGIEIQEFIDALDALAKA